MKTPSRAQVKFAKIIAHELSIPLPKENTAYEYWKFIHDNREKFEEAQARSVSDYYEEYVPREWFY